MKTHTFHTTKREFKKLGTMPLNMQVAAVLRYAAFHTLWEDLVSDEEAGEEGVEGAEE